MQRYRLLFLVLLLSACATRFPPPEQGSGERMSNVALYALSLSDTPYRYGGNSPGDGFDCSGFVRHVFENSLGVKLPRTSAEMSSVGVALSGEELQPGDLVFFNTRKRPYSHVGIYVGEDRFVHSPSSGKAIMVVNMRDGYWRSRYNGARRIIAAR